jgi:two-component system response regulator PilR (NtrC family)
MQVKLLRAIQEKSIRPVGSQTEIPVDIRLLSATHKNLAREVEEGNLRQDLYYRINVIELKVPPLRDRKDDIPLLVRHILDYLGDRADISDEAMQALRAYDFPGNVRELENMLQRACALAENQQIQLADLPELTSSTNAVPDAPAAMEEPGTYEDFSLEKHLETIERKAIEKALNETRWNRTEAARKLGMSFRSLRYRLKKLGLD